jgi:hypothetical protein
MSEECNRYQSGLPP